MDSHQKRFIYSANFRFCCCYELFKHRRFPAVVVWWCWYLALNAYTMYYPLVDHSSASHIGPIFAADFNRQHCICRRDTAYIIHCRKCPECQKCLGLASDEQSIFHICFTVLLVSLRHTLLRIVSITRKDIVTKK